MLDLAFDDSITCGKSATGKSCIAPSVGYDSWTSYLRHIFTAVVCDTSPNSIAVVEKYFAENFVQHVDGKTLTYDDFVQHMKAQKSKIEPSVTITWHELHASKHDSVVHIISHHSVSATMKSDSSPIEGSVVMLAKINEEGKIFQVNEHSHISKGSVAAQDIGSTTEAA